MKELQSSSSNLASDCTPFRGGLYSRKEVNRVQESEYNFTTNKDKSPSQDTEKIYDVEFVARIAFIAAYGLFNFFYWIVLIYFT